MNTYAETPPVVLVFSAHDPSGAAGIQADIESINRNHGRSVSVITALTAQNTQTFESILPQSSINFRKQADLLLEDVRVAACKIGLIGSVAIAREIADILEELGGVPMVFDPVLRAGTGTGIIPADALPALLETLVTRATVLTPNIDEALMLTGKPDKADAAAELLARGCRNVLITGADAASPRVLNTLYTAGGDVIDYEWERLAGSYHGSGCTLASSIAAQLALRRDVRTAVECAQEFTWNSLKHGCLIGRSQRHPDRNFRD